MTGGPIPGGEDLAGDNESRSVGAEIREKVGEAHKGNEASGWNCIKSEAKDAEDDGQDHEATNLKSFASDCIDESDWQEIPGNETC